MALLQSRRLIRSIILPGILLPLVSFAQVTIKEKVEIQPKVPSKVAPTSERQGPTTAGSSSFFYPSLFGTDPYRGWGSGLALRSTLTISGSIMFDGDIAGNQHAALVGVWGQEYSIAWKGKAGWEGVPYAGESPYTGTFSAGTLPNVRLYLFDYMWTDRAWDTTLFNANIVEFHFTGYLSQGPFRPAVPVTAIATASGSVSADARFDSWYLWAGNMTVTGHDSTDVYIVPLDGTGHTYSPFGFPAADAEVTLRVDGGGDYVFLSYEVYLIDVSTGDWIWNPGPYHSGRELTMPLAEVVNDGGSRFEVEMYPYLVYDGSKGSFFGETETVYITATGGGKTRTIPVVLRKLGACASVAFRQPRLAPGETTTLELTKEDGSPIDAGDALDVAIMAGTGTLEASGKSGTSLSNVHPPVTFTAPSSIEGDSLEVQVAAFAYYPVAGGVSGGGGGGDALSVLAKGSSLQKKAPRRAAAQTMALNSDRAVLERIGKLVANNSCIPGKAVVNGGIPKLNIYLRNAQAEYKITKEPLMPTILPEAFLENSPQNTDINFFWKMHIQWVDPFGKTWKRDTPFERAITVSSRSDVWVFDQQEVFVGGDQITVEARATIGAKEYQAEPIIDEFKILGENPDKALVIAGLSIYEQAVIFQENRYRHFNTVTNGSNKKGFPSVGINVDSAKKPISADYGLMQINTCNHPTLKEVWNWRANKMKGLSILNRFKDEASLWPGKVRDNRAGKNYKDEWFRSCPGNLPDTLLWVEAFKRYNGGSSYPYWTWAPKDTRKLEDGGEWRRIDYEKIFPPEEGKPLHKAILSSRYADRVFGYTKNPPVKEGW